MSIIGVGEGLILRDPRNRRPIFSYVRDFVSSASMISEQKMSMTYLRETEDRWIVQEDITYHDNLLRGALPTPSTGTDGIYE
jgi:hypothetical protein